MEDTEKTIYPRYYCQAGRVIKVVNSTETRTIILPPASLVAERFTTHYPSPERLLEEMGRLTECTDSKYKEYLFTFYQQVDTERKQLNALLNQANRNVPN